MQKTRTTVRIAGKEYTIASTDSPEYVNRVASWVDRRMNELSAATHLPAAQLAVLTAVNTTDEMMKSRDDVRRLEKELDALRGQNEALRDENEALRQQLRGKQEAAGADE